MSKSNPQFSLDKRLFVFTLIAITLLFTSFLTPCQAQTDSAAFSLQGVGATVPTYSWIDAEIAPKAVVIGLHGGVQHGRNYDALAQKLAPKGYIFYAIDFRGHGEWLANSKKRPKVNYYATSKDLVQVVQQLRERHPKLPLYCIGESLGAAMAMHSSSNTPHLFDGMILVSAGIGPASKHHFGATVDSIGQGIKTLGGTIDVSPHIVGISDDPRSSEEMLKDPLGRRKSSVWSLLHTVAFLHSAHKAADKVDGTPVLVLQGEQDRIINPSSTKALYTSLATKNKNYKTFPEFGHLLVTSQFLKDDVVAVVEDWLSKQVDTYTIAAARTQSLSTETSGSRF